MHPYEGGHALPASHTPGAPVVSRKAGAAPSFPRKLATDLATNHKGETNNMKISCLKEYLAHGLGVVSHAVTPEPGASDADSNNLENQRRVLADCEQVFEGKGWVTKV